MLLLEDNGMQVTTEIDWTAGKSNNLFCGQFGDI